MVVIYSVNFENLTEKINPPAFEKYLKDTGWKEVPLKRNNVKFFQYVNSNNDAFQIDLPMDKSLFDYKSAMYQAVETVAYVEGKSTEQLMLFLLNPNADILKIRLEKDSVETGSILFDDAISVYENAKKLIVAATQDVLHPKKYHQGRVDDKILQFVNNCRFGQTEIGSYVISVVCPFAEFDEKDGYRQMSLFSEEEQCAESLTRKVTNKIMNNVANIKSTIDNGNNQKLIEDGENSVISVNFYEALKGLNFNNEDTNVELIAQWSPAVKKNRFEQDKIKLSYDYYQPISYALGELRKTENSKTKILGMIKKLESVPDLEKRTSGKITVVYLDNEEKKKIVTAELGKDDYVRAIEAHEHGYHVEIIGNMNKTGRNNTIKCDSFSIID